MARAVLFLMALCTSGLAGAQVDGWLTLESPSIPFHRTATLTLSVEAPAELELELPNLRPLLGDLPMRGMPEFQSEIIEPDRVLRRETYVLDPFKIHDYVIGPVRIEWEGGELVLPQQLLRVRELTEQELAQAEEFDSALTAATAFIQIPLWRRWEFWGALAVIAVAGATLGWTVWRSRGELLSGPPPKPAWEVAIERMDTLAARKLAEQGEFEPFYVDLSAILRYYIEGQFQLHAPERTTPEFLEEVSAANIFTPEQENFLAAFLRHGDRVKFAQYEPTAKDMDRHFGEVRGFVDETIPREGATPEAAAA